MEHNKEQAREAFQAENPEWNEVRPKAYLVITPELLAGIIRLYPGHTNREICEKLGITESQRATLILTMRRQGVTLKRERESIATQVAAALAQLKLK